MTNVSDDSFPRPMRIAQVAPLWMPVPPTSYGGTEMVVHLLTEGLVRRGHDVTLFAPGDSITAARLYPVGERCVAALMGDGLAHVYDHYANAAIADAVCLANEFDVIHCHLDAGRLPMATARWHDPKAGQTVFTLHTCPTPDDAWALTRYPSVPIAVASRFQASLVPPGRTSPPDVVPHGIDFDAYPYGEGTGGYLAYVGRMCEQKGPLTAIEVARRAGMPLILAGGPQNEDEEAYFAARVRPMVDGRSVRYVGPLAHGPKVELLRGAAALLFPIAGHEAFGLIVVEAMACGTPVVATSQASAPELIDAGTTGVHASTSAEMAQSIGSAVALDRKRVRGFAAERFGLHRMISSYERWFAGCVSKGVAR
jgi:glycosyltransferase involved in cell wall biosynthesis